MKIQYEKYKAKKILNAHKHGDDGWFWTKYTAHPYIGCQFGCEYCYLWGTKYSPYPKDYEKFKAYIKVKENAPELLRKELQRVPIDIIGVGDWQPAEKRFGLSRKMLQVCLDLGFPVYLLEKSPGLVDDLDLIKKINKKSEATVGFSIVTAKDDKVRKIFEPTTPSPEARFAAMKKIAKGGIITGVSMMPILPFFHDTDENIEGVARATKEAGGKYILASSLTLEQGSYLKKRFLSIIKKHFPEYHQKYIDLFQLQSGKELYGPGPKYWLPIEEKVKKYCKKYGLLPYIPRPVKFWSKEIRINKEIAATFALKAKDLYYKDRYRAWSYRKANWALDELEEGVDEIYKKSWLNGLKKKLGIGDRLARAIEGELSNRASL